MPRSIRSEEEKRRLRAMFAEQSRRKRLHRRLAKVAGVTSSELHGVNRFHYRHGIPEALRSQLDPFITRDLRGAWYKPIGRINSRLNAEYDPQEIYIKRKTAGLVKGPGRLGGTQFGTRHTLRHEIGHNVWSHLPKRTQKKVSSIMLSRANRPIFSESEEFAEAYAHHRGGPARRDYKRYVVSSGTNPDTRQALALALSEYRKIIRKKRKKNG